MIRKDRHLQVNLPGYEKGITDQDTEDYYNMRSDENEDVTAEEHTRF